MDRWFVTAPWWALALVIGATVALVRFVGSLVLLGDPVPEAAISGVVGGALIGLVLGPVLAGQNRRAREALGTDDPVVLRRALRTARRGPVPEDPLLREQARRTALVLLDNIRRQRRWTLPVLGLAGVLLAVVAVLSESLVGWALLAVVLLVALLPLVLARRLARRAELLRDPPA